MPINPNIKSLIRNSNSRFIDRRLPFLVKKTGLSQFIPDNIVKGKILKKVLDFDKDKIEFKTYTRKIIAKETNAENYPCNGHIPTRKNENATLENFERYFYNRPIEFIKSLAKDKIVDCLVIGPGKGGDIINLHKIMKDNKLHANFDAFSLQDNVDYEALKKFKVEINSHHIGPFEFYFPENIKRYKLIVDITSAAQWSLSPQEIFKKSALFLQKGGKAYHNMDYFNEDAVKEFNLWLKEKNLDQFYSIKIISSGFPFGTAVEISRVK
ncbi:MAG: hypothetical protein V1824_01365 [archaeon]